VSRIPLEEQGVDPAAGVTGQLNDGQGEGEAGLERFAAGQGADITGLGGAGVDDAEVVGEAEPAPGDGQQCLARRAEKGELSLAHGVGDERPISEQRGEVGQRGDGGCRRVDATVQLVGQGLVRGRLGDVGEALWLAVLASRTNCSRWVSSSAPQPQRARSAASPAASAASRACSACCIHADTRCAVCWIMAVRL
jgi:hypothetical protein